MKYLISGPSLGLAILLVGSVAVAQVPGNADRMGQNRQGGFGNAITRFDTDGDGVLSADEVAAAENSGAGRIIQMMDRNQDGKIDADEVNSMDRMRQNSQGGFGSPIARFDTDGDGVLSVEEVTAAQSAGPVRFIQMMDRNKDGQIDAEEVSAFDRMRNRMRGSTPDRSNKELSNGVPQLKDSEHLIFLYMNGTARNQDQAKDAYIINSEGEVLHKWDNSSITSPEGAPGYLTPDGLFLRGVMSPLAEERDDFSVGKWGVVQLVDWEGNVVWEYDAGKRNEAECFHHDVELMPNGNILVAAFRKYDEQEAARKYGWNVTGQGKLLVDVLYEIKPNIEDGTAEIAWEWKWMDHVIQDRNPKLPNFGVVAEHPEKIDINYFDSANPRMPILLGTHSHINSIDYNPERDEIMFTSITYNEIYIIDHSTTSKEASSSRGGKRGKGGDLLYRWGNPAVYDYGGGDPEKYAGWEWTNNQHDARWLLDGTGNITVHNNVSTKNGKPDGMMNAWSQFFEIELPYGENGYTYVPGRPFEPSEPKILAEYNPEMPLFNSVFSGGGQKLTNGHVFTTSAAKFTLLEHDDEGNIIWFFDLKDLHPDGGQIFKAQKYPIDYPGFSRLKRPVK